MKKLKLTTNLFKITKKYFSQQSISEFPYKFGNEDTQNNLDPKEKFENELITGFNFAYKNLLFAISEKDEDYIKQVCEEKFGDKFIHCLNNIDKIYINSKEEEDKHIDVNVETLKTELHYLISTNRARNKAAESKLNMPDKSNMLGKMLISMNEMKQGFVYLYEGKNIVDTCVVRFRIDVKSNLILSTQEIKQKISRNHYEYHYLIMEAEYKNPFQIFQYIKDGNMIKSSVFGNLFKGSEKPQWKIADLDNYMNGNPLV